MSDPLSMPNDGNEKEYMLEKEWLIANGLGGYASNSIACIPTRKYHGLLIAALPKHGRTVMLNHLREVILLPDNTIISLGNEERPNGMLNLDSMRYLEEFYLDHGLPVWRFNFNGYVVEKRIFLTYMQNTVHVVYKLISGDGTIRLKLFPYFHFRTTNVSMNADMIKPYVTTLIKNKYEISYDDFPSLKLFLDGENTNFVLDDQIIKDVFFRKEAKRGYAALGEFWSPGYLQVDLNRNLPAALLASTESWEEIGALTSYQAYDAEMMRRKLLLKLATKGPCNEFYKELILAADQFIIVPASRIQDRTRANAAGDEIRTIIAGYHWFTDWGRDTMISLEGLTLCTGRVLEARWILRTFAYYVKNGLIPNMFPEGEKHGLYHTADASLWFFHSLHRYVEKTQDRDTLLFILPKLIEIYKAHLHGTHFGIHVDAEDGLLIQGEENYQLTWMDAKVDNWVVTPRRGKAVEINALWYNALKLLEKWLSEENQQALAQEVREQAEKAYLSFNQRFWNSKKNCLYDVIDGEKGDDDALRPNQLFAISLDYPILKKEYWEAVFKSVKEALLAPVGLRSLDPTHPDFKSRYDGDLRARDSAYHQGTIWSWLVGPYIDTWLKLYPNEIKEVREYLFDFKERFKDAGIGYISEIFDATEPYTARGCIAQAWSIAEILRCWLKTEETP